jgi:DNA adenine methylase
MLHCKAGERLRNNKHHIRALQAKGTSAPGSESVPPFLRWAGSKRQILDRLAQYWRPSYERYVEPFAGSACLFFAISPSKGLLGDINSHLVETLITVRDDVESVIPLLASAKRDKELYYQIRSLEPQSLSRAERASQFIYLNRYCFNGLYRTNREGRFNVPFGAEGNGYIPTPEHLRYCSGLLRRAEIVPADFESVLARVRTGDFVYLDPPYLTKQRRVFREYDPSAFSEADLKRLRKSLVALADRGIPFLVSYAACNEAQYLARGFHVERGYVRRSIAGFAGKRVRQQELLISPEPPH